MELDELKQLWTEYNTKLSANLKLNEELLRKMNLSKARQELQRPLVSEVITIVIVFLAVIFVTGFSIRVISEIQYSVPGLIGVIIGMMYVVFSTMKVNRFLKIDYYNLPVVKLQRELSDLNRFIIRFRRIEFIMLPFLVLAILPVAFKTVNNIDIYSNIPLFIFEVCFIIGISFLVGTWINRNIYDKKLKDAERFLKEIENFEKEFADDYQEYKRPVQSNNKKP